MRVCAEDGCPEQVKRGYCPRHRPRRSSRSPSSYVTGTRAFRRVRDRVLRRDRYRCHYCGRRATTVDHVNPVARNGDPLAEDNLVASCGRCNFSKGASHG